MVSENRLLIEKDIKRHGRENPHLELFSKGLTGIRANFSPEKEQTLFSEKTKSKLEEFVKTNPQIENYFERFFLRLKGLESANAPGHDFAHLVDNLDSALRIIEEEDLSDSEKLEIITSCMLHDFGRSAEGFLSGEKLDDKGLEVLIPALAGKELKREFLITPSEFDLRVLYNIGSGSKPTTGHLTADIVSQCDREQLIGSPTIFRGLAFDVGIDNREIFIPLIKELKYKLPRPETENDRYWLVQYEFFMRNLYPPVSRDGEAVSKRNKQENTVILMLALEGNGEEYFNQVFGPELGLITQDEGVDWSKKPIPKDVFENAKKEKKEFLDSLSNLEIAYKDDTNFLTDFTIKAVETDKVVLPENFNDLIKEKLNKCTKQERKNYWKILIYALIKRHQRRKEDLERLGKTKETSSGFMLRAANLLIDEIKDRENKFAFSFPGLKSSYGALVGEGVGGT